jgi:hypothetical protein
MGEGKTNRAHGIGGDLDDEVCHCGFGFGFLDSVE